MRSGRLCIGRRWGAECLVVWLILCLASLLILGFGVYVSRIGLTTENDRRYLRIRIALGGLVSLLYGTACFLLPQAATHGEDTFLFIALSTIVALGGLSFAVVPAHYLTIALGCFLPLLAHYLHRYFTLNDSFYLLMSGISVLWLVLMIIKIRKVTATHPVDSTQPRVEGRDGAQANQAQIQQLALRRATGLGNRRYFEEMLARAISAADRSGARFGLLAIDLNDFKPVNDRHGHATGDRLLQSVAERLRSAVRVEDFCARLGGDEFAVIALGVDDADAMARLPKLRDSAQPTSWMHHKSPARRRRLGLCPTRQACRG